MIVFQIVTNSLFFKVIILITLFSINFYNEEALKSALLTPKILPVLLS